MYQLNRRRSIVLIIAFSVVAFLSCTGIYAEGILENSPVEVSADTAVKSKYVWRGFLLDDDPVMQPGIYLSAYGFTASLWGSYDIDGNDSLSSDEVDYSLDYTYQFDRFSLSVGHTYYDFPAADLFSREVYIGAGVDTFLSPTVTWYYDYGEETDGGADGHYVSLEISHSVALGENPVTLDLSGLVGYNNEFFILGDGGHVALGMGLSIPLTEKCSLSPNVNYSIPFGDLEDSNDGNQSDEIYSGVTLAFSF